MENLKFQGHLFVKLENFFSQPINVGVPLIQHQPKRTGPIIHAG